MGNSASGWGVGVTLGHTGGTVLLGGEWGHSWSYWRNCAPGWGVGVTPGHTGGTVLLGGEWG